MVLARLDKALVHVLSPDGLTTIHTWAHLTLATHMKAGLTNDPSVALTTVKLRIHTCP